MPVWQLPSVELKQRGSSGLWGTCLYVTFVLQLDSKLKWIKAAAGVFNYIIKDVLPNLRIELSSPQAGGYDMTESYLGTLREFVLAEAQECYWQQAVLREPTDSQKVADEPRGELQKRPDWKIVNEGFRVL